MSKLTNSFQALRQAFDTFTAAEEASGLPAPQKPSVLLLTVDPLAKPNARAVLTGDAEALAQALLLAIDHNEALREALAGLLPDLLDRA